MGKHVIVLQLLAATVGLADAAGIEKSDLTVLAQPARRMMRDYLTARIDQQFASRAEHLARLRTAADWDQYADRVRKRMIQWTGPLPPRTALNARVVGEVQGGGYRLQKIIYESRPNFLVTANLYLPAKCIGKSPAVLNVIGHSAAGKAADKVQRRSIAQARRGLIALTIDAIGQGERQITDYAHYKNPPGNAHQIIGVQAFLAGTHVFNLMLWDAIRGVDYLVSRPEVDAARIACTGCSGGGMMTTYMLPFEPRISIAIPACNPNTWSYRVHAGLATDHEQVFFGAFADGIDPRGDPLFCQVPKPLLIDATTHDNLNPPDGVRELDRWLGRAYAAHHAADRFATAMVEGPHGYNQQQREAAYRFMLRWFKGDRSAQHESEFSVLAERDTWCMPGGNVFANGNSRQPQQLVLDYLQQHRPQWQAVTDKSTLRAHQQRVRNDLRQLLRISDRKPVPHAAVQDVRRRGDLKVTAVVLQPETGIQLPVVLLESESSAHDAPAVLYLHDRGKAALIDQPLVATLLRQQRVKIVAVDLRGLGETAPSEAEKFWSFLSGRTIFAQRVEDVRSTLQWMASRLATARRTVIWANGTTALYALCAVALDGGADGMILQRPLLSFESVIRVRVPAYQHTVLVPGVLEQLDLPQIYQACWPRPTLIVQPLMGDAKLATDEQIDATLRQVVECYAALGTSPFHVVKSAARMKPDNAIRNVIVGRP